MYGEGISKTGEIIDIGVKEGIIENLVLGFIRRAWPRARECEDILKRNENM